MRFEWDDKKNASNRKKHGVSFETAEAAFDDPFQLPTQDREVDGEVRWQTIARAGDILLLTIAHTVEDEHSGGDEVVRIISARQATTHERRKYDRRFY